MELNRFAFIEKSSINNPLTFISFKELLKNSIRHRSKELKKINNFFNKSSNKIKDRALSRKRVKDEIKEFKEENELRNTGPIRDTATEPDDWWDARNLIWEEVRRIK